MLLVGSADGRLCAFNIDDGSCVLDLDAHPLGPVSWVGFAGSSSVPMSGTSQELAIWDVTTGEPRHRAPLGGRAFRVDPSGTRLALFGSPSMPVRALELVDLETMTVTTPFQDRFAFELDAFRRQCLMEGLDEVGLTLARDTQISKYEAGVATHRPWMSGERAYAGTSVESTGRT